MSQGANNVGEISEARWREEQTGAFGRITQNYEELNEHMGRLVKASNQQNRDNFEGELESDVEGEVVTDWEEGDFEEVYFEDAEGGDTMEENIEEPEASDGSWGEGTQQALLCRRVLNSEIKDNFEDDQRHNLFHTRCLVNESPCSVVIDGGSCTNVVSSILVKRLNLPTKPHPKPYKLQWLNNSGELKVHKQAIISFSLGKYKDEVVCDVVPMHAGDILLGRPWQFDRRVIYDGYLNRYTFTKDGRKTTLVPLSSKEVFNDQCKLEQRRFEFELKEKELKEKEVKEKELSEKLSEREKKALSGKSKSENNERKEKNEKEMCEHLEEIERKGKSVSYHVKMSEVRIVFLSQKPNFVLMCKVDFLATNLNHYFPSVFENLFQVWKHFLWPNKSLRCSKGQYIKERKYIESNENVVSSILSSFDHMKVLVNEPLENEIFEYVEKLNSFQNAYSSFVVNFSLRSYNIYQAVLHEWETQEVINETLGAMHREINSKVETWENCLPFIENTCNRIIHHKNVCFSNKLVYGLYAITPFELLPLKSNVFVIDLVHFKYVFIKLMQTDVKEMIAEQVFTFTSIMNKRSKQLMFHPRAWVWMHFRKKRLQKRTKLHPRGDGPYQILARIFSKFHTIVLHGEYYEISVFNVINLSHFDVGNDDLDSRTNLFEEGEDDMNHGGTPKDPKQIRFNKHLFHMCKDG